MNRKIFKYENKNRKKIRVKDLLMLFSIFALCVITVAVTGTVSKKDKKTAVNTEVLKDDTDIPKQTEEKTLQVETAVKNINETKTPLPKLEFQKMVDGTIIKPHSPNELIYSETMDDWRIHNGVDIACPIGSDIVSAERGVVKSVKYDINYGNTVIVESDEYTLIYSSLSSEVAVSEGETISKGQLIGKSADSCMIEICDEPHIHFEMTKNNTQVDPLEYIHFN